VVSRQVLSGFGWRRGLGGYIVVWDLQWLGICLLGISLIRGVLRRAVYFPVYEQCKHFYASEGEFSCACFVRDDISLFDRKSPS
jgi:hypothetical protein